MKNAGAQQLKEALDEVVRSSRKARRRGKARDWHKLRTSSRRLRGALLAHAGLLEHKAQEKLSRRAKRITRLPAEVRDLDVALENLEVLHATAESAPERQAARVMRRRLRRKRDRQERRLRRRLERDRPVRALAHRLKKALAHVAADAHDDVPTAQVLQACAREVLTRRDALGDWDDDQALHALRVSVKKLRGALQAQAETGPRPPRPLLATLQDVQTLLGEHHDWSELGDRLDLRRCKLLAEGARHHGLIGYELLLSRAREEQKARYDAYRAQLHDRLPALLADLGQAKRPPRPLISAVDVPTNDVATPAAVH